MSAEAIRAALKGLNITDLGDLKDVALKCYTNVVTGVANKI